MLILYMSFIDDEIHRRLFEEIYMTYRKQMFLVARAVLSNDSDAEDAVHDVFLKIAKSQMQKIGSIQEAADVRSYSEQRRDRLCRIVLRGNRQVLLCGVSQRWRCQFGHQRHMGTR